MHINAKLYSYQHKSRMGYFSSWITANWAGFSLAVILYTISCRCPVLKEVNSIDNGTQNSKVHTKLPG